MKNSLRTILLAAALIIPAGVHAEDMKMCEPGAHCPMMERMDSMQAKVSGMMDRMHTMIGMPCGDAMKKDMEGMMKDMQNMHEHMGQMMNMMSSKGMMDKGTASENKKVNDAAEHESHH